MKSTPHDICEYYLYMGLCYSYLYWPAHYRFQLDSNYFNVKVVFMFQRPNYCIETTLVCHHSNAVYNLSSQKCYLNAL